MNVGLNALQMQVPNSRFQIAMTTGFTYVDWVV